MSVRSGKGSLQLKSLTKSKLRALTRASAIKRSGSSSGPDYSDSIPW